MRQTQTTLKSAMRSSQHTFNRITTENSHKSLSRNKFRTKRRSITTTDDNISTLNDITNTNEDVYELNNKQLVTQSDLYKGLVNGL